MTDDSRVVLNPACEASGPGRERKPVLSREEQLRERMKELDCLYAIARLNADADLSLEELLRALVEVLPPAVLFPERAAASLKLQGEEYATPGWNDPELVLESRVFVDGVDEGRIAVGYSSARPGEPESFFLGEERRLLDMVAERVGHIIERRRSQEALQASESRIKHILETVADGFWDLDMRTGKAYQSPKWYKTLGYEAGELEPSLEGWLSLMHPEDRERVLPGMEEVREGRSDSVRDEVRLRTKAGEWLWVQSRGRVVEHGPNKEALRVVGILLDISERKAAEEKARRQAFVQEVFYELTGRFGFTLNYEEVVILILVMLDRALSFGLSAGFYEKNGRYEMILRSSASVAPELVDKVLERMCVAMSLSGGRKINPKAVQLRTMFTAPERYGKKELSSLGSEIFVPVFKENKVMVGALLVGSEQENAYTGEHEAMLLLVVEQACRSLDSLHAMLAEEEEEYGQLFRSLPLGVILLDGDNSLLVANEKGREDLGALGSMGPANVVESLGGMPLSDILPLPGGGVRRVSMRVQGREPRYFDILAQALEAGPRAGSHVVAIEEVTDRQRSQEALASSERRFRTMFDHAGDSIFVLSLDGAVLDVNQVACDLLGYTREELMGMTVMDIVKPSAASRVAQLLAEIRRRGAMTYEVDHRRRDGTLVPMEFNARMIRHEHWLAILATARDMTERRRAEQAMEEQRCLLAAILDGIRAAFFVVDGETLNVVEANEQAQVLTGLKVPDILYKPCREVLRLGENGRDLDSLCRPGGERILDRQAVMTQADGQVLPVSVNRIPAVIQGRPHFIITCFDISERKAMERRLTLAQKMESIGQLAAGIAHEINTPIQFIANNLHFLAESFTDLEPLLNPQEAQASGGGNGLFDGEEGLDYLREEIPQTIKDSLEGVDRIATIVMAMKKFSHAMTEEKRGIDLNEIVNNTLTVARNEWKYACEVETDFDDSLTDVPLIPGDMDQVVLNLVTNAAHAITDKVAGTEDKGTITITTRRKGGFAELSVADTGVGIPEADRDKVFNPFFTTKEVGKGTGQGLSIVHGIVVDRHGGEVDFESEPGKGTAFTVRLPMEND